MDEKGTSKDEAQKIWKKNKEKLKRWKIIKRRKELRCT